MGTLLSPELQDSLARLLLAALALLAIWLLRRLVIRLLLPLFRRLVRRSKMDVDDLLLQAIGTPVRLLLIALGLHVAVEIATPGPVPLFVQHLTRTLVILAVFAAAYQTVGLATRSTPFLSDLTGVRIDEQLLPFVRTALRIVLLAIAIVIVLQEWEYDVGGLIAGLGLGGLAFALAAQDTAANLFGFTTIVGDRPLVVGEYIITPDVSGTVERVGFRSTRIRQLDQAIVTIPNSKLASSVILNWSRLSRRRVNFTIGITYAARSDDIRRLIERIEDLLKTHEAVIEDTITVLFTNFGDSALEILVRCYVTITDWTEYMREQQAIMLAVMDLVRELGLDFAFPSRSVYIENLPGVDAVSMPDALPAFIEPKDG